MGKTWNYKSRSDRRDFIRSLSKGKVVYVIDTPRHAGQAHLWNHAQTWTAHTVGGKHPLLREWYFGNDASNTAEGFLGWHGTVYEDQPQHVPHHSDPMMDVRDEGYGPSRIWEKETRTLNSAEYRNLNTREAEAKGRYDEDRKAKRRGGWF